MCVRAYVRVRVGMRACVRAMMDYHDLYQWDHKARQRQIEVKERRYVRACVCIHACVCLCVCVCVCVCVPVWCSGLCSRFPIVTLSV